MKAITVAFDKADSYWYPKDIPVYPYRHNDLIEQCYLGTDKVTEFTDRPRKTSSPPKFLGRSHSQTTKDTIPTTHKKRIDRIRSSTHGISPSDLKPELSINFSDLMSPTRLEPPSIAESYSLLDKEPLLLGAQPGEDTGREGSDTMSSSDYYSETSSFFEPNRISAPHLRIGRYIKVKVKILRIKNLDKNCANVLLQNRFLYENQEPYSSNIYTNDGDCCEINHLHVYRIKVGSLSFSR